MKTIISGGSESAIITAPEYKKPDTIVDSARMIAGMMSALREAKSYEAERYWDMAKTISEGKMSRRDIRGMFGIPEVVTSALRKLYSYYGPDGKKRFVEAATESDMPTEKFIRQSFNVGIYKRRTQTTKQILVRIYGDIRRVLDERNDEQVALLYRLRDILMFRVPPEASVSGKDILAGHACCCCGTEPEPGEKYEIESVPESRHMLYPVCPRCLESGAPPDFRRIADMYVIYSMLAEEDIARLQD